MGPSARKCARKLRSPESSHGQRETNASNGQKKPTKTLATQASIPLVPIFRNQFNEDLGE